MSSRTRSSSNSASALNLFTNPFRPSDPLLPSETRGFSFDPSIVSRKTMRGYAIGIPVFNVRIHVKVPSAENKPSCTIKCSTPGGIAFNL